MTKKLIIKAYNKNVRDACKAEGNRVPQGYSTAVATNGDFVVYNALMGIVGRLPAISVAPFTRDA